ncbi:hypothetical protein H920_11597 [Fukomys damarensis]|uniref:Uncharacterized protein n=1 Tax=Fukomys damarensis TaxID=885580 RepID=A0A091DVZ2_FUKDA|nr:hypothetical protein H920_11597 [Fukomys damarensis]
MGGSLSTGLAAAVLSPLLLLPSLAHNPDFTLCPIAARQPQPGGKLASAAPVATL